MVNVINERADDIYDLLRTQSKRMKFLALGSDEPSEEPEDFSLAAETTEDEFDETRFTDNFLETALGPDKLAKRLLGLAKDAKPEKKSKELIYSIWQSAS